MSTLQKLTELEARRLAIQTSVNDEAKKAVLAKGKLTARDRVKALLDDDSFVEIGTFMKSRSTAFNKGMNDTPADGVVCGYGTVNGSLVYVYSQDAITLGGSIGEVHAQKIVKTYEDAMKMGAPVVGFIDTIGLRLEESIDALQGYGALFNQMAKASGVIPQIAVVCGDCAGGVSFVAGLSDFTFIATKNGRMFLNSPNTLEEKGASYDAIAAPKVHLSESGLAVSGYENEEDLIAEVVTLLGYLPSNNDEEVPCYPCTDDLNRVDPNLNQFDFEVGSVAHVIESIVDDNEYLELYGAYGQDAMVAFGRMNGATVGFVGNQNQTMDVDAIQKVTEFVTFCDAFNIPLVTLTNIQHFTSTVETEKRGIIKEASKLVHAFASATVPKINVILKEAYGTTYITMNSKHIGCDYVYAWPTAEVSVMNSSSAVKIMFGDEIAKAQDPQVVMAEKIADYEAMNSAYGVAARGYIDDIIEPAATRKRVIAALEILLTKQVAETYKKHPTV
ncbi:MAG: acyl-CoA carboxylase subunit beta [Cellulosilyticaceae bacterium]